MISGPSGRTNDFNDLYEATSKNSNSIEEEASSSEVLNSSDSYRSFGPSLPKKSRTEMSLDEQVDARFQEGDESEAVKKNKRKLYVGSLAANITEKPLKEYFQQFGDVDDCRIIRDRNTGISRGFGFVTFMCETMAEEALSQTQHKLEEKIIRVSNVYTGEPTTDGSKWNMNSGVRRDLNLSSCLENLIIPPQKRIYVGPLDDSVMGPDLSKQFLHYGSIHGVSRMKGSVTCLTKNYGFIDFAEVISTRRAFGSKVFVKGKHVKIAMSRFALEVVLSSNVIFFLEAHMHCPDSELEKHFGQYGQIYRCHHFVGDNGQNKSYGFVDYISPHSAKEAIIKKNQLLFPGQYVKVTKILPQNFLFDLFVMSDKDGNELSKRLDGVIPTEGTFGRKVNLGNQVGNSSCTITTSKVRLPASLVPKVIGERGKVVAEICRDSKTQISIPKTEKGCANIIVSITGTKQNIKTAQYLMQKIIKGEKVL